MMNARRSRSSAAAITFSVLFVTLQIATWAPSGWALPSGAPELSCQNMLPFHGGGIPAQTSLAPYEILTSAQTVGQGQSVRVDIVGLQDGLTFGGFMIMARNRNSPFQTLGQFNVPNPSTAKLLNCDTSVNNAVTHTNTAPKTSITLEWQAPADFLGEIVFRSTVAQSYSSFWVGIESEPVKIVSPSEAPVTPNASLTNPNTSGATRTTYTPTAPPNNLATAVRDTFYDNCGKTKTCFGVPNGCLEGRNCMAVSAVNVRGENYEFEMRSSASNAAYVALGLSEDDKMGDDLVTECLPENGQVNVYTSYTSNAPYGTSRVGVPQNGVQLLESSFVNGVIYCRVQRVAVTNAQNRNFDLINKRYHLLLATGSSVRENGAGYHDLGRLAAGSAINLAEVQQLSGASMLLVRLHGAFMIAAWIGTTSLGILLARYFKQTWVGSQLCGKDQWFAWHRICMITTWTLTMVAFILIFVELGAWSAERNPHAILGLITTILCFIQPIGAFFRPGPTAKSRPIFNWLHWLGGNVAHIMAIVTIFFAVQLTKAQLPDWMDWVLVGYVVVHVCVHLILSIGGCAADRQQSQRVNTFQLGDVGGHHGGMRGGMKNERRMDAPYAKLRKGLLGVYICVLLVFVIALILIVVLAPVEEYFNNLQSRISN